MILQVVKIELNSAISLLIASTLLGKYKWILYLGQTLSSALLGDRQDLDIQKPLNIEGNKFPFL